MSSNSHENAVNFPAAAISIVNMKTPRYSDTGSHTLRISLESGQTSDRPPSPYDRILQTYSAPIELMITYCNWTRCEQNQATAQRPAFTALDLPELGRSPGEDVSRVRTARSKPPLTRSLRRGRQKNQVPDHQSYHPVRFQVGWVWCALAGQGAALG